MKKIRYLILFLLGLLLITNISVFAQEERITESSLNLNLSPEELKFIEADYLYLQGEKEAAIAIYQTLKPPFESEFKPENETILPPVYDPSFLPVKAAVYWRLAQKALAEENKLETKILTPLKLLLEEYSAFIPAQIAYSQALKEFNQPAEALAVLEKATAQYPDQPDLLRITINTLAENKQWLEASLIARQFAIINQENPAAPEFQQLADKNLQLYQRYWRSQLTGNAIANILTGALGYALTKDAWGAVGTLQTTIMLLQGESKIGEDYSNYLQEKIPLIKDEDVTAYIEKIGQKLAFLTGRNEFNYEFFIVEDEQLNAFALPGGKIFINAGAILKTKSEAELAGLLAHEISHAVLSHGFQLMTEGNLTTNVLQIIPLGNTVSNLVVLNYSRKMEKEADILGTKILVNSGYASDGLLNLTKTLATENKNRKIVTWLSSHPATGDRVEYLESLIRKNNYSRYSYEGILEHSKIKAKVSKIMAELKEKEEKNES